jgi:hypothetical protein
MGAKAYKNAKPAAKLKNAAKLAAASLRKDQDGGLGDPSHTRPYLLRHDAASYFCSSGTLVISLYNSCIIRGILCDLLSV